MNMLPDWALKPLYIELRSFFADFDGYIELEKPTEVAKRLRKEIDERQNKLESVLKAIADQVGTIKKEPDTGANKFFNNAQHKRMTKAEFYNSFKK